jgi:Protein of unknown function (DUF2480)
MEDNILVNRVADSGLITINMEHWYPEQEVVFFDIKQFLYMELILKEKDFRDALKSFDWNQYQGKIVVVGCSIDAIIPVWAYMLIATNLTNTAFDIFQSNDIATFLVHHFDRKINEMDISQYADKRIVIKGCSDKPVPEFAYLKITQKLLPIVQSIMYGEPCSTVPVFKRPRKL